MKHKNLLTNIFSIVLMVSLVIILLAAFNIFPGESSETPGSLSNVLSSIAMPLALISIALIDIVFPLIDNRVKLKEKKYLILTIVKLVLFAAAVVFLMLHMFAGLFAEKQIVAIMIFCILYLGQFVINLDPKPAPVTEEPEDEEYDDAYDDENSDDEDDSFVYDEENSDTKEE